MARLLDDPFLKPYEFAIRGRANRAFARAQELAGGGDLAGWANAHLYYGLSKFDGTDWQYFHSGGKGWHSAWGSRCFDYGKTEVLHFLLSNCKF